MRARYACTLDHHDFEDFAPVESASGMSSDGAAVVFARRLCRNDPDYYSTFEGGERVRVRCLFTGEESAWIVCVRSEPHFSSTPAKSTEEKSVSRGDTDS